MKKLALILISLEECFPKNGFSGGGHKVTKYLILELIKSKKFDIDIYCQKGSDKINLDGISSIKVIEKKNFAKKLKSEIKNKKYDYILSSDILLPFANNLVHSHSSMYKSKNGKKPLTKLILRLYNSIKIHNQRKNLAYNRALFAVSNAVKKDYVSSYGIDNDKVFVSYPSCDLEQEEKEQEKSNVFTIGAIAGGGLNKGSYLLLLALKRLQKDSPIKARFIIPKRGRFFKFAVKLLGLTEKVEFLPKQKDMTSFYKSINCYVLPSLNEAFGLVVAEAATCCCPTISSSTTGASEVLINNIDGFVFDRTKKPIKNLSEKLIEASDMYFNDFEKYNEVCKNAHKKVSGHTWEDFTKKIIENLISEG